MSPTMEICVAVWLVCIGLTVANIADTLRRIEKHMGGKR